MSTQNTILQAWRMATRNRNVEQGSIFHYDTCFQYTNNKCVNVLNSYKNSLVVCQEKGYCWNNATAESFFKTLKTELIYRNKLISNE